MGTARTDYEIDFRFWDHLTHDVAVFCANRRDLFLDAAGGHRLERLLAAKARAHLPAVLARFNVRVRLLVAEDAELRALVRAYDEGLEGDQAAAHARLVGERYVSAMERLARIVIQSGVTL